MEDKIGEIVTLPFCNTKVKVVEAVNGYNICEGCYYENHISICEEYQNYGARGECFGICREDHKDIIYKPLITE